MLIYITFFKERNTITLFFSQLLALMNGLTMYLLRPEIRFSGLIQKLVIGTRLQTLCSLIQDLIPYHIQIR